MPADAGLSAVDPNTIGSIFDVIIQPVEAIAAKTPNTFDDKAVAFLKQFRNSPLFPLVISALLASFAKSATPEQHAAIFHEEFARLCQAA